MCKVYAVASMKGGVTKTTTTLNLATALNLMGKKVLAIDLDPQGSLTICAGVNIPDKLENTIYALLNAAMDDDELPNLNYSLYKCGDTDLDIIPSNIQLAGFELNRGHEIGAISALQTIIEPLKDRYDYIIIDTPPSLGVLTANAITASDSVIIPVTPQLLSAVGMKMLLKTIKKIQRHVNSVVKIEGVLMSMCDTRTNLYSDVCNIMEKTYSQTIKIFNTVIPQSTKVGEANLNQQSVLVYDKKSKPSRAYMEFAKELTDDE